MFFLALFTPVLGDVALKFGAYEFFWLAVFGVMISGNLTGDDPLKGWIAGFLGLFLATVGQEGVYAYERFTFGNRDLAGGISLVPALVGAFGFAELLIVMREKRAAGEAQPGRHRDPEARATCCSYWRTILRSGVIGTFIGIIPGVGEDVRRLVLLRRGEARQQGEGAVRQGLGRGPDGRRDRRQRLRARRHHPGAHARRSRARRRRPC